MKTFFLKLGKGLVWVGSLLCLSGGAAFAGENELSPPPLAPPMLGLDGPYLGTEQVLRVDGEKLPIIRGKIGYDSVLLFPGKKVRKIFLGGYSWSGSSENIAGEGVVILDPPYSPRVDSNLVVVFERGISIFQLKTVDPNKPFMARTVVRFEGEGKGQRPK